MAEKEQRTIAVMRHVANSVVDEPSPHGMVVVTPAEAGLQIAGCAAGMRGARAVVLNTTLDAVDEKWITASPRLRLFADLGVGDINFDICVADVRSGIVDDAGQVAGSHEGCLGGAELEGVENEPQPPPEPLRANNVTVTPHIGSATPATHASMAGMAIRNPIARLAGGNRPDHVPAVP